MKKSLFAFIAMATALALVPAASSAQTTLCPNAVPAGPTDTYNTAGSATPVSGPLNATCGTPDSAVQLSIPNDTGYARLEWTQGTGGVPTPLTLGSLTGLDANVSLVAQAPGDQPFYEITVQDSTDSLGLTSSGDQLMFLEFQPTTLAGTNMAASANSTLFNMYDNSTDVYLNQAKGGQADAHTLAYWFTQYPDLSGEQITSLRIGIGFDGGPCVGPCAESLTINSLEINPPVPAPESSSMPMFFLSGLVLAGVIVFKARAKASV